MSINIKNKVLMCLLNSFNCRSNNFFSTQELMCFFTLNKKYNRESKNQHFYIIKHMQADFYHIY